MGSEDGGSDEKPVHIVYLDGFWIDRTEVTNKLYAECVEAGICTKPYNFSYLNDQTYQQHPVISVNWNQAKTYCNWVGRFLPTEAEWEKAARGTDGRIYPWGESIGCQYANFKDCREFTTPVGSYQAGASPYGVMDMAGNVWEWVADWYAGDYYSISLSTNPQGPSAGKYRVYRGGSWFSNARSARSDSRNQNVEDYPKDFGGFRCAIRN